VFETALEKAIVVGEGIDGQVKYTSKSYHALEEKACALVDVLLTPNDASTMTHKALPLTAKSVENVLAQHESFLSEEQRDAVKGLTQDQRLAEDVQGRGRPPHSRP
jgi:hypothetical protein